MDSVSPASTVHFYDTGQHRILCGVRGFEGRSTKHARGVTCDACVGLLAERARSHAQQDAAAAAP